jgi:hypothetical protein
MSSSQIVSPLSIFHCDSQRRSGTIVWVAIATGAGYKPKGCSAKTRLRIKGLAEQPIELASSEFQCKLIRPD